MAEKGRGVGDLLPGLAGRLRGGDLIVMPLASNLGASHVFQLDVVLPLAVNSCIRAKNGTAQPGHELLQQLNMFSSLTERCLGKCSCCLSRRQ